MRNNDDLGIYAEYGIGALDHDTAMLIDAIVSELTSRDVSRIRALASIRRVLRRDAYATR